MKHAKKGWNHRGHRDHRVESSPSSQGAAGFFDLAGKKYTIPLLVLFVSLMFSIAMMACPVRFFAQAKEI